MVIHNFANELQILKMDPKKILQANNLSHTNQRIKLLSILAESGNAITEKEIESHMKGYCNKTTIYRNLNSMVEKKILHRIISDEAVRYKLKYNDSEHVHFICRKCDTTYCLEEIAIQKYKLPDGFKMLENQFLIIGICKRCEYGLA